MNNKCVILTTNTKMNLSNFKDCDFIGVERGCLDIIDQNIKPIYFIGDFDHVSKLEFEFIKNTNHPLIKLDEDKDIFDGEYAIKKAKQLGYKEIIFIANPCQRLDLNFSVLTLIANYNLTFLTDQSQILYKESGNIEILYNEFKQYKYIGILSFHNQHKITIKGLKYEVNDYEIGMFKINALSNNFINQQNGYIKTEKSLYIIFSN